MVALVATFPSQSGTFATKNLTFGSGRLFTDTTTATALTLTANSPSCTTAAGGIVSWYRAEGNANDGIGPNNGTFTGGATAENGRILDIDGDGVAELVTQSRVIRPVDRLPAGAKQVEPLTFPPDPNDPNAAVQMAALYASGHCVRQDRVKAYQWFATAYNQEPHNPWIAKNMNQLWGQMTPQQRRQFQ